MKNLHNPIFLLQMISISETIVVSFLYNNQIKKNSCPLHNLDIFDLPIVPNYVCFSDRPGSGHICGGKTFGGEKEESRWRAIVNCICVSLFLVFVKSYKMYFCI